MRVIVNLIGVACCGPDRTTAVSDGINDNKYLYVPDSQTLVGLLLCLATVSIHLRQTAFLSISV
jgi:hypothetical protein